MSEMFSGSICVTDILEKAKQGHSAFSKGNNGKIYMNVITWLNDKKDDYGNVMSHQLSSTKDKRDEEVKKYGKVTYIGNSKRIESKPIGDKDLPPDDFGSNIPVREKKDYDDPNNITQPVDDLPF